MSLIRQAYLLETYGLRLNMEQLAHALGLAVNTVYNQISAGKLKVPTYMDNGKRWADAVQVAQYMDDMAKEAA